MDAPPPNATPIYRMTHVNNLETLLRRGALHSPNQTPKDGLPYITIHNVSVQASRHAKDVPCGPRGTIHDYVPFYFGPLSPMLLNLKTGRVPGYSEGQHPIVYLVSYVHALQKAGYRFVFTDGHAAVAFTEFYDSCSSLDKIDWGIVKERYWSNTDDDNDRQRRKQAEFLVWQKLDWSLICEIGVIDSLMKKTVDDILDRFPKSKCPKVSIHREWYYA